MPSHLLHALQPGIYGERSFTLAFKILRLFDSRQCDIIAKAMRL
jgi:hypothetical protein